MIVTTLAWLHDQRKFLTLFAMALAAGALWIAWGRVTAERDQWRARTETLCEIGGHPWASPAPAKGEQPGQVCQSRLRSLVAFERDVNKGTADQLVAALDERLGKENVDAALARRDAAAALAASQHFEEIDHATPPTAELPADWWDALFDRAGLR